ncbi:hypothetical protein GCM10012284_63130 [Mangrovihabitans endophyticus]|uniref:Transmembrane protein n=2 Tax=Mangrovihabitans endophyticus TaxID=1751298 RepID=A0A8J3C7S9_9ACTN|nr:hypothetical protein GCM10012284_63130 [Mangrovihabitans endophyticus]
MIDATRQLRWYLGLGLLFVAFAPTFMMALLAAQSSAPPHSLVPVLVAGPINVVGFVIVVRGMVSSDPVLSARALKVGGVVIAVGVVLLYLLRAALVD